MRIAIVTFFFPPGDQIGGRRPFALARRLSQLGHDVLVVTRQPSPVEDGFRTLVVEGSAEGTESHDVEPGLRHGRGPVGALKRAMRLLLAVPDGKTTWAVRAARRLRLETHKNPFDVVLTTGPPHSVHLAGLWGRGTRSAGANRFIVDMRDLWTDNPYYDYGPMRKKLDSMIESRVMRRADAIVAATEGFARSLNARHGVHATGILTGYDDSMPVHNVAPRADSRAYRQVVHAGNLYAGRRDPTALLEAAGALISDGRIRPEELRLTFVGPGTDSVTAAGQRFGLEDVLEVLPPVSHTTAMKHLQNADVLLLVMWNGSHTKSEVPGKLFEYLALRKPIVALGASPHGEVARILDEVRCGCVVNSKAECRAALESVLRDDLRSPDEARLAAFSQSKMAEEFLGVVQGVVGVAP